MFQVIRRAIRWCDLPAFTLAFTLLLTACQDTNNSPRAKNTLFTDTFTLVETGAWLIEGDETAYTTIEDEQLIIAVDASDVIQLTVLQEPLFDNFVLEVDTQMLAGNVRDSYGVLFHIQDNELDANNWLFYRFELTGHGWYIFERHNTDGTWTRLTNGWQQSPAIKQGLGVTNHISIVVGGASFFLYVNEVSLGQFVDDSGLTAGKIALDASTFGRPGLRVAFDNIVVREP